MRLFGKGLSSRFSGYVVSTVIVIFVTVLLSGCGDDDGVKPESDPYTSPDYFVLIVADTFQMGGDTVHEVILTRPFHMSQTEVTNAQYAELAQWAYDRGYCTADANDIYDGTQPATGCRTGPYLGSIVAVGSYLPNGFGLYDMHGNLWEWCNDWYAVYSGEAETDPVGPGTGTERIVRGGSWSYAAQFCSSSMRSWNPPSNTIWLLGVRPVLTDRQ